MVKTKDGTILGPVSKPRRGVSPFCNEGNSSSTVSIGTGRSPSPSSSEKPAPSYLMPTVRSHGEVKKKVPLTPDNAGKKPVFARRSSLDRPPTASHLQKVISSTPRERSVTVRSSSFSGRTGTSYRPVSEKASAPPSKTPKAVSRTTHSGNNIGGKTVARKNSAKKKEESSDKPSTVVDDANGNCNSGKSSVPEGEKSPSPTREKMGEVAKMVAVAENENAAMVQEESEDVKEDHHHAAHLENDFAVKGEVAAEKVVVSAGEEDDKNSMAAAQLHEEIVSDQVSNSSAPAAAEAEDKSEDEHILENNMDAKEEKEGGDVVDMVANYGNEMSAGEKRSQDKEGEEEKRAVGKPRDNVGTATSARKDPAQANNDVIEETTKKLMESKKNKVMALAGAFETVILLEKPNHA